MASAPMAGGRFIITGGGDAFRIAQLKAFHHIGRKPEGEMRPCGRRIARLKGHGSAA